MSFNSLQRSDFFGRAEELHRLSSLINRAIKGLSGSITLEGSGGAGKTELLKHLFGRYFWKQDSVAPFYYRPNRALLSASDFSRDYLVRFLLQRTAFDKKDQSVFYRDGTSAGELWSLLDERGASWALEILDRYERNCADPLAAIQIALTAPRDAALKTGKPVAVLLDDFPALKQLHLEDRREISLASLFETPMSFGRTPHVLAGNAGEMRELDLFAGLERVRIGGLGPAEFLLQARSLLGSRGEEGNDPPQNLLDHLRGNPFYLSTVINRACEKINPGEHDYQNAYLFEISDGTLSARWASALKRFFPLVRLRKFALGTLGKLYQAGTPLSIGHVAKLHGISNADVEEIGRGLSRAGLVNGEYGLLKPVEDNVLRDVIDCLYVKEILGKPYDPDRSEAARAFQKQDGPLRFEMTLPMTKEVELVAAQCLEQIGKNLHLDQDSIGQLQIAVIEACINAAEHSKSPDKTLYLRVTAADDRLEVSVESAGQEFALQETGEPFEERITRKPSGRGWGIKLMKQFVDEVRFEKTERGTKTVLIKKTEKTAGLKKEGIADHD